MGLFSDSPKGDSPALREAIEAATKRLKEDPGDAAAVLRLADALAASGRKTDAVRALNRYGPIVQSRGRLEEAIAIYKKATQLDPESELTSSTFLSYLQLRKLVEAEREEHAEAPPVVRRPPSGFYTRPGPDPPPPSGAFPKPVAGPPASGSFPLPAPAASPPPSGSFALPQQLPAPPPSGSFPRPPAAADSSVDEPMPVTAGPSDWSRKKEAVHEAQAGIPLLRDIPPILLDLVLQKINLVTLAPGEVLFREGSEGSSVFFVVQGSLDVVVRSDAGEDLFLRIARNGEAIGEASFLTSLPRYASVTAREPSNLLELDHNALVPIARKHRPLADALNRLYEERVLTAALVRSRVFGILPEAERRSLTRKLSPVLISAGTVVVREGQPADAAFVVKRGAFRVTFRSGDREVAVALLRPHELFGDLGDESGAPQAETVTAVVDSELLRLAPLELAAFRSRNEGLAAALDALRFERAERCVAALRASRRPPPSAP
ncbi:MAG: cyclic nucleotide-binding domain-containing protein [Thermoanaerobaculia bacterium]